MSRRIAVISLCAAWFSAIATLLSPFATMLYDAFSREDTHFVYRSFYRKNPILEWNRQMSTVLKQMQETIKDEGDLPKSLLKAITRELQSNAPALAAASNMAPFDSRIVDIYNVSRQDLKNIRVHFLGCTGYDSHITWPDAMASQEPQEELRKRESHATITYRKLARRVPDNPETHAQVIFVGSDASQCNPKVEADLENGTTASGKETEIGEFMNERYARRRAVDQIADITFRLGLFFMAVYLFVQIRMLRAQVYRNAA